MVFMAGVGRTRFFTRYVRNIAPQLHPPHWLFNIFLNAFLDQAGPFSCFLHMPSRTLPPT